MPTPLLILFANNSILNTSQCGSNQTNDQWSNTQCKSQGNFLCVEELSLMRWHVNELFSITGSYGSDILESLINSWCQYLLISIIIIENHFSLVIEWNTWQRNCKFVFSMWSILIHLPVNNCEKKYCNCVSPKVLAQYCVCFYDLCGNIVLPPFCIIQFSVSVFYYHLCKDFLTPV